MKKEKKHSVDEMTTPAPSPELCKTINERVGASGLSCAEAFAIAEELSVPPSDVGRAADHLEVRLTHCQLGLFGYGKPKKIVKPVQEVPESVRTAIDENMDETHLSCSAVWKIAADYGHKKLEVAGMCEAMKVKIRPCQLGAF